MTDTPITVLYDGLCPICAREIRFLKRRDKLNSIIPEDIAAPGFDPARYGLTMQQAIGAIHAIRADGSVLRGVDVFIDLYPRCGLGWLAKIIAFKPTRPLVDLAYRAFARIRPRFSALDECASDRCQPK